MFYRITRSKDNGNSWQDTPHIREADSVNEALQAFGMTDAIKDPSVTVAIGHKTGRAYTAVPVGVENSVPATKVTTPKVRTVKSPKPPKVTEPVSDNSNVSDKEMAILTALRLIADNPNQYSAKDISDMFAERGEHFDARWLSPVTKLVKRNKSNNLKLLPNGKTRLENLGNKSPAKVTVKSQTVDAPYGLKADGTPAKKRGRKPRNESANNSATDAATEILAQLDALRKRAEELGVTL